MKQLIFYLENERTLSAAIRAAADAQASLSAAPRTLLITIFSANWTEQAIERTIQEAGDAFPDAILLGSRVPRVIYNGRLSPVGTVIFFTFFASAQLRLSLFDAMEERLFSVKQISPFSSSEFPIVIVGKSPLSAGLVRKHVPLLHPAA
ncbi:hypothetical protein [Selenomonas sp.]|jgi:hypothetical protein|uniref:hypothetical protein n=1 Tax=Selenomonas sp. TaxID=2053611 RepID=UPI003A0FC5E2